jgi:phosphatidylserine/phosphatidylglycerophosphate/cardiolipin synthase-like enzyme
MAQFLDTTGVSHELTQLIKKTKEKIIFISPFLNIAKNLEALIQERDSQNIDIRFVYGKNKHINTDDVNFIRGLSHVKVYFCENLHAKCYLNESTAIITSMNLYEYSQQNNQEMGIKVDKATDPGLYDEIAAESLRIIRISDEHPFKKRRVPSGYCIHCRTKIPLNIENPLCDACYTVWKGDKDSQEHYCHICGKESETSFENPICQKYRCQQMFGD